MTAEHAWVPVSFPLWAVVDNRARRVIAFQVDSDNLSHACLVCLDHGAFVLTSGFFLTDNPPSTSGDLVSRRTISPGVGVSLAESGYQPRPQAGKPSNSPGEP